MKKILIPLAAVIALISCNTNPSKPGHRLNDTEVCDTSWKQLSLREKIGQTVMITANPNIKEAIGTDSLPLFLKKYPVGGFFMSPWTMFDGIADSAKENYLRKMITDYKTYSKYPPFIVQDYEGGIGHDLANYTKVPAGMLLGAAQSTKLAYNAEKAIALEAKSLGFNWVLHPVADLNFNPLNPVTNIRSVSDNPDLAIKILSKQIKGLQENGIAATIKHFPGDGMASLDQHLTTTANSLSEEDWWKNHGKVFSAIVDSGAYSVMIGHIRFPAYQMAHGEPELFPGTLSPLLVTELLKKKMGFKGVVVSDALNMGGIQGYYPSQLETEIACFNAGVDVMLWPTLDYIDTLEARILRKEIPMERLDDAVSRIWNMKHKLGLFDQHQTTLTPLSSETKQFAVQTAQSITDSSVTILQGAEQLPIKQPEVKKILFVVVSPDAFTWATDGFATTVNLLKEQGFDVEIRHNLSYYSNKPADQLKYDRIIFAFSRHPHDPIGSLQLQSDEALTAWMANSLPHQKVIAISYGDPYVTGTYVPMSSVRINAYTNIEAAQKSVVDILTGSLKPAGKSPVHLP